MVDILQAEEARHENSPSVPSMSDNEEDCRQVPRRLTEILVETEAVLDVLFGPTMADLTTFGEALPGIVIFRVFERSLEFRAAQRELLRPFFKQLFLFDLPQKCLYAWPI